MPRSNLHWLIANSLCVVERGSRCGAPPAPLRGCRMVNSRFEPSGVDSDVILSGHRLEADHFGAGFLNHSRGRHDHFPFLARLACGRQRPLTFDAERFTMLNGRYRGALAPIIAPSSHRLS